MLSAPRTLADIATDGFLAQADRLAMFRARFGEITKVGFLSAKTRPTTTTRCLPTDVSAINQ